MNPIPPTSLASELPLTPTQRLVVVHYHWRAGGVRRVIERTLPKAAGLLGACEVVLASGSEPPAEWFKRLCAAIPGPIALRYEVCPQAAYVAELADAPQLATLETFFFRILQMPAGAPSAVVWLHNPGLAKNPILPLAIARAVERTGARAIFHHHDFWCDNRWERYTDALRCGLGNPNELAQALFPGSTRIVHAAINRRDFLLLRTFFGERAAWIPNGMDVGHNAGLSESPGGIARMRAWLWERHNIPPDAPLWVLPARLLRRKNILEALWLRRIYSPHAWIVTTGAASGGAEAEYARKVRSLAAEPGRNFRVAVLEDPEPSAPYIEAIQHAADVLVLCSLQEGFGLAYLEAAALERPLLCRRLPNIFPDLQNLGFSFPGAYESAWVPCDAIDLYSENMRRAQAHAAWLNGIPKVFRNLVAQGKPAVQSMSKQQFLDFARLTLEGQIEAINSDALLTTATICPSDALRPPVWPSGNQNPLSAACCAARFVRALAACGKGIHANSTAFQWALARQFLSEEHFFPLLHSS
jgi:glycosyltransferase involved in cell wall biosynthesis